VTKCEGPLDAKRADPRNPNEFGKFLNITFTITEGEFANRLLWMNNNILVYPASLSQDDVSKAQTAMAIGARERKVLLDSIGKTGIEMAEELIGAACKVTVAVEKNSHTGKMESRIKRLAPLNGRATSVPAATPTATVVAPKTATTAKAKMPWEK